MNVFKNFINWLHLWLGLASGLVVMVVALTGSLMVFQDELEPWLFERQWKVANASGQRLGVDALIPIAEQAYPGRKVNQVRLYPEADRSVHITLGQKGGKDLKIVFVDPYTGRVLGKSDYNRQFFMRVRDLHRYLLAGDVGKVITTISCTVFLFLVISGLILWWPANKNALKQRFRIKWSASGKRVNWDVHAVGGFYLSLVLVMISCTGMVWSYKWVNNLIFQLADGHLEKREQIVNKVNDGDRRSDLYENVARATDLLYAFKGDMTITLPAKDSMPVTVVKENRATAGEVPNQAWFDNHTGKLLQTKAFAAYSTGAKIRRMVLPLHSGSIFGWPTKLLALTASLFAASLPVTGFSIWLGRKKKKKAVAKQPVVKKKEVAMA